MKKYKLVPVVLVLILAIVAIGKNSPVWAGAGSASGNLARGFDSPMYIIKTVTENGTTNIGGVCTITVNFNNSTVQVIADAEVPVSESEKVPFNPVPDPKFTDESLLFPGCHFVHQKLDATTNKYNTVNPMDSNDGSAKVCFGATPTLTMAIYYYLDSPSSGTKVWIPIPSQLEDQNRLICASAPFTGVYMPSGKIDLNPTTGPGKKGGIVGPPWGGSVRPPPDKITITHPGLYAIGGICTLQVKYFTRGLSDTVEVEYANDHLTQETLTVPSDVVKGVFYFPGCHVVHYLDNEVQDQMTPEQGQWKICFAAIPDKVMTIYYYQDNMTEITPPWTALETTTKNGVACADLVDWTAVYAPAGE